MPANDRYKFVRLLGEGGMGRVFLAHDTVLDREVAIKTIRVNNSVALDQQIPLRDRFVQEARIVARLSHPAIVTVFDIFGHEGELFIVMEYVDGRCLADTLVETPVPLESYGFTARAMSETAAALDYAHSHGVIHRDVKPANLLLDRKDAIKITDFGIAKLTGATALTATGNVVGTADYMSPEQIRGESVDGRADQYSLAVMAFYMLTGRKPFEAGSFVALTYKICHEPAPPASAYNSGISRSVDAVLARALSKDPARRFETCSEFASSLCEQLLRPNLKPNQVVGTSDIVANEDDKALAREPTMVESISDSNAPRIKRRVIYWSVGAMVLLLSLGFIFVTKFELTYRQATSTKRTYSMGALRGDAARTAKKTSMLPSTTQLDSSRTKAEVPSSIRDSRSPLTRSRDPQGGADRRPTKIESDQTSRSSASSQPGLPTVRSAPYETEQSVQTRPIQPVPQRPPESEKSPAAPQAVPGEPLLQRVRIALGGEQKLGVIKDIDYTADIALNTPGGELKGTQRNVFVAPSSFRQDLDLPVAKQSVYSDGKTGWMAGQGRQVPLPGPVLKQVRGETFRIIYHLALNENPRLVDDHTVELTDGSNTARLVVDDKTGLPLKVTYSSAGPSGPAEVEETYSDWRDVNGIKVPFARTITQGGTEFAEVHLRDCKINSGITAEQLSKKP